MRFLRIDMDAYALAHGNPPFYVLEKRYGSNIPPKEVKKGKGQKQQQQKGPNDRRNNSRKGDNDTSTGDDTSKQGKNRKRGRLDTEPEEGDKAAQAEGETVKRRNGREGRKRGGKDADVDEERKVAQVEAETVVAADPSENEKVTEMPSSQSSAPDQLTASKDAGDLHRASSIGGPSVPHHSGHNGLHPSQGASESTNTLARSESIATLSEVPRVDSGEGSDATTSPPSQQHPRNVHVAPNHTQHTPLATSANGHLHLHQHSAVPASGTLHQDRPALVTADEFLAAQGSSGPDNTAQQERHSASLSTSPTVLLTDHQRHQSVETGVHSHLHQHALLTAQPVPEPPGAYPVDKPLVTADEFLASVPAQGVASSESTGSLPLHGSHQVVDAHRPHHSASASSSTTLLNDNGRRDSVLDSTETPDTVRHSKRFEIPPYRAKPVPLTTSSPTEPPSPSVPSSHSHLHPQAQAIHESMRTDAPALGTVAELSASSSATPLNDDPRRDRVLDSTISPETTIHPKSLIIPPFRPKHVLPTASLTDPPSPTASTTVHHPHHVNLLSPGVPSAEVRTDANATLDAKKLDHKKKDAASGPEQDALKGPDPPAAMAAINEKEKPKPKPKPLTKEEQEQMLRKELQTEFETGHFYEIIARIFKEFREIYASKKFLRE